VSDRGTVSYARADDYRAQLVTRVGPNEVRFAPFDRWAEPLAESFGRTLQQDLLGVLGVDRVVLYPWSPSTRFVSPAP
jgi:hypothetical protein